MAFSSSIFGIFKFLNMNKHTEKAVENLNCRIKELEHLKDAAQHQKEFYENCIKTEDAIEYLKTLSAQKEMNMKMVELDPKSLCGQLITKQIKAISDLIFLLEVQEKI